MYVWTDRQTDGRTDGRHILKCLHGLLGKIISFTYFEKQLSLKQVKTKETRENETLNLLPEGIAAIEVVIVANKAYFQHVSLAVKQNVTK